MGVEAIANFLSASANGQTNGRRSSALNCHRRLSFSFYIYPSHSVSACLSLEPKMMKSTKRQRQRQRRLNCKMLSSCWFLFFFLFFHLFCFCFGRWQRCVFSPTRMQLLAAAPSPRRLSSPYFSLHLALLQRIVDRATRTSSNQICFMTTATTQNDAQTHTHTHTNVLCVCV